MEISFLPSEFGLGYGGVRNSVGVGDGIGCELEEEVRDLMSGRKRKRRGVVMVGWVYVVVVSRAYRVLQLWCSSGKVEGRGSSSSFVLLSSRFVSSS